MAKKGSFKKLIRTLHLWLGLTSGLVVFTIAVCAAILVFEDEGRDYFQHDFYHVATVGARRLPVKQLVDTFKVHFPKDKITNIRWKEKADAAVLFISRKNITVSIDPYTSGIIGVQRQTRDFYSVVLDLHTHLLMGDFGNAIIKANVLIFFIMCVSGLILWWPKQKRFFKQAVRINFRTKNWKRLNWDLHSVLGFYALIVLFIVSLTGMFMVYDSVKQLAGFVTHSPVPPKEVQLKSVRGEAGVKYSIDKAYATMASMYPGATETFITPAGDSTGSIRVLMRYPYAIARRQNSMVFDQYSGKVLKTELYTQYTGYDYVAKSNYNLHTGKIAALGIGSKIIWFLAALIAASMPVTGFMIWLGRKSGRKSRKTSNLRPYERKTPSLYEPAGLDR
ncbi:PepSY-associated TM helix domain-containing protein [Puia sp. P3]|uniref:PepSY-associated TM helix domain-containing protein n=1 Tax=Puia sp. P3 TaxID=3423952 RepID=UPI003D669264